MGIVHEWFEYFDIVAMVFLDMASRLLMIFTVHRGLPLKQNRKILHKIRKTIQFLMVIPNLIYNRYKYENHTS